MAQYNGYVQIPHGSYQEWRNATLGNGYNVDNAYGNQCWDFCAELWYQYGLRLVTRPAGNGIASDCWNISRYTNAKPPFTSIEGKENIKRGDVLVWNGTSQYPTGHIAFADEDYNGTDQISCLGQNQGQGSVGGSNVATLSLNNFLGIFRNTNWQEQPPTPTNEKRKFKWVLYARKLRQAF